MAGHTRKQNKQKRKGPVVSGAPQKGTVGAYKPSTRKPIKKSTRKPVKKTTAKKPTPKKSPAKKTTAKRIPKGRVGALIAGGATLIGGLSALRNKPKTFGEKFKEARAKGERTIFDYKGKKYSAVTKDDLKRAGYTNLRDYLNAKNKKKK